MHMHFYVTFHIRRFCPVFTCIYSKRHNKFLFPSLAGSVYGSSCKAENEISNVVNYTIIKHYIIMKKAKILPEEYRKTPEAF